MNAINGMFWPSSPDANISGSVLSVDFSSGGGISASGDLALRLVRTGQ